ncbi:MAG TPA: hypothetical protein VII36_09900 [Usitatibacter sp.]
MTKTIRRYAMALLASFAVCLPAAATTSGDDYTDLWWAGQAESGWGMNLMQQGGVIFATMFVYGTDNTPRWYVATMLPSSATVYTGQLLSTTGTYFGAGSFTTGTATPVGNMSVNFISPYAGTLSYTVNGTGVTKSIIRESFAQNNLTGHYLGGLTAMGTNCHNGTTDGPILIFDTLTVTQSGSQLGMTVDFFASNTGATSRCTFNGTLTAQGRVGFVSNGTWSCTFGGSPGNQGTFTLDMVDGSQNGFNARFAGSDQFCTYNGFFGGLKDVL